MKKGTKVKNLWGEWVTVLFVRGNMVMTIEDGWYHKTKLLWSTAYLPPKKKSDSEA